MAEQEFDIRGDVLMRCASADEEITVPDGVRVIGWRAFAGNLTVRKVVIPEGVKLIGDGALSSCSALKTIRLPDSLESLGEGAFALCDSLESIRIPPKVTSLPRKLFMACNRLTHVELPEYMTDIGPGVFAACGMEELRIPNGVTCLQDPGSNDKIRTLILPAGIESFDPLSLPNLVGLTRVVFPASMTCLPPEFIRHLLGGFVSLQSLEAPGVPLSEIPEKLRDVALVGLAEWEARGNAVPEEYEEDVRQRLKVRRQYFRRKAASNPDVRTFLERRGIRIS